MNTYCIHVCDARSIPLADGSVDCCVTSPPYWGLRDYGVGGQIGLEATPQEYVEALVSVFREVRRVLRDNGTLWLNIGDSYAAHGRGVHGKELVYAGSGSARIARRAPSGLKPKDLVGIPWRVAFALQADGWYLRSDIIWAKPNPMPESVTDRPTKSHEYVFLLSKSEQYRFDADAIREALVYGNHNRTVANAPSAVPGAPPHTGLRKYRAGNSARKIANGAEGQRPADHMGSSVPWVDDGTGRNPRSVWTIHTEPCREAHFAVMPRALARKCILAGCPKGGTVLDPFGGAGTVALEAVGLERNAAIVELNPKYADIARNRLRIEVPLLAREVAA